MYVLHEQYTSNVFLRKHFKLSEVHTVFSLNIYTVALATSIRYITTSKDKQGFTKSSERHLGCACENTAIVFPGFFTIFVSPPPVSLLCSWTDERLLFPLLCGFAPNHLITPTILFRVRLPYLSTLNGHSKATCLTSVTAHGPQTSASSDGTSSSILMISGQMEREKRKKRKEKRKTVGGRELEMIKMKRVSARGETRAFKTEAGVIECKFHNICPLCICSRRGSLIRR